MPATGNTQTGTSGQRRLGRGRRPQSGAAPHGPPDAGALAREAVISFLRDASEATAEREAERAVAADGAAAAGNTEIAAAALEPEAMPRDMTSAAGPVAAETQAWRLAAISAAALDRIEAAAAKVEADIAVAHRAYERLQAGAGAAAEAGVRAAQSAAASAGTAVQAEQRVRICMRQIRQNVVITTALLAIAVIALLITSSVVY